MQRKIFVRRAMALSAVIACVAGCNNGGGNGSSKGGSAALGATAAPLGSNLAAAVVYHTATSLQSGAVLVVGGMDATGRATNITEMVTPSAITLGPPLLT